MHDFIYTITRMFTRAAVPALAVMAVGGVVLLLLYVKWYGREGIQIPKGWLAATLVLLCYLGGLVAITLLLRGNDPGMRAQVQTRLFLAFWEAWNAFTLQVWLNPLLNIAMFVPLGVLLPLAAKPFRKWYWMLAAGSGTSLIIEALQFFLKRGQADVDDLFCNTLGAMIGYCLCMAMLSLWEKKTKRAGAYAVLPVVSSAALAGIFLAYQIQPYGNLANAPIFPADISGTSWVLDCELSDQPGPSGVYWAEPFTKETCDAFAVEFMARQGTEIRFGSLDVQYYDNTTYYGDNHTYCLIVDHNDCSYRYSDYRIDPDLRYGTYGTATEAELRAALSGLGIDMPEVAEFVDVGKGEYIFRVGRVEENGTLTDGELICGVAEGGALHLVDNQLSVSTLHGEAPVISQQEAYQRLCAGRFSYPEAASFEHYAPKEVHVTACTLEYLVDSKGYRQPVYYFTLSDEQDAELRGGHTWRTFVPALA